MSSHRGGVARYQVGTQEMFTESAVCEKAVWSYLHVAHVSTCEGSGLACVPWRRWELAVCAASVCGGPDELV